MSLYRRSISDNVLVWEKRKLLPRLTGWRWVFNRSDEDYVNKMKNELAKARALVAVLQRRIPNEEDRIEAIVKGLRAVGVGATSTSQRDRWLPRRSPVRLLERIKVGRKKKDRLGFVGQPKPDPVELARIVTGPRTKGR